MKAMQVTGFSQRVDLFEFWSLMDLRYSSMNTLANAFIPEPPFEPAS